MDARIGVTLPTCIVHEHVTQAKELARLVHSSAIGEGDSWNFKNVIMFTIHGQETHMIKMISKSEALDPALQERQHDAL